MMDYYFLLDGVSSLSVGIELTEEPPIVMPEERGENVTILGRTGDVFLPESEDENDPIYEPYLVTLHAGVEGEAKAARAMNWLRGRHYITFCNQPERVQRCRVLAGSEFKRVSPGMDWYEGDIVIKCQPDKYRRAAQRYALTSGGTVINAGDLTEHPGFFITGSGSFSITVDDGEPFTLTVNGAATVEGDALRAYDAEGYIVTSGAFPKIPKGSHTITFTEGFSVEIVRRERFR